MAASEEAVVAEESAAEEATIKPAAADEAAVAEEAASEEAVVAEESATEEAVAEQAAKEIEKPAPAKTVSNPPDKRHIEVEDDESKSWRKKNRRKQIKRVLAGLVAMARESEAFASLILAWSSPPSRLIIAEVRVCTPGSSSSLRSLRTRAHSPSPRRSAWREMASPIRRNTRPLSAGWSFPQGPSQ